MQSDRDFEEWDPMHEDFATGKEYKGGPGAIYDYSCLTDPEGNDSHYMVIIRHLPVGITVEGVKNLCLSASTSVSVQLSSSNRSAMLKFKKIKEAELTIRDLNNTPPYFLNVSFVNSREKRNSQERKNKSDEECENKEKWIYNFQKCSFTEKLKCFKSCKKSNNDVLPYFNYNCEFDNPSLIMRQRNSKFDMESRVYFGRGYINMGNRDRYKCERNVFTLKSDNWDETKKDIGYCSACGNIILWKNYDDKNVCSKRCKSRVTILGLRSHLKWSVFEIFAPYECGTIEFEIKAEETPKPCCVILEKVKPTWNDIRDISECQRETVRAKEGDRVLVCIDDQKRRGIVLGRGDEFYEVALIDYGKVVTVQDVYASDADLEKILSFGGVVTFFGDTGMSQNHVRFRINREIVNGSWDCDVLGNNEDDVIGRIILDEWSPPFDLTYVTLESGCKVVITSYRDMSVVYVRRIENPWNEEFMKFNNDIAAYSLEGKKYDKFPKLGEICSARFKEDGCFYRGIVQAVKINFVVVEFLDFGNRQETELENLRYLPPMLKVVNCFAVRVKLKNAPEKSSPESVYYLNQLTALQTELSLTFDVNSDGEVILTEQSGDHPVVNNILSDLVVPIWEKDSTVFTKSGDVWYLNFMEKLSFTPGKKEDIFLLNFNPTEFSTLNVFWATHNQSDLIGHLNGELKKMITEYCNYLENDSYLPRKGELCLAQTEGHWYRALTLSDDSHNCELFLLDFGDTITVDKTNIRKILKQFLEMPALAIKCTFSGIEHWENDKISEITDYMKSMIKKCIKNVDVVKIENDVSHLSIPFAVSSH